MKIDKDLALLFILSTAFALENTENEVAMQKAKSLLVKYGINIEDEPESIGLSEEKYIDYIEQVIDRIQLAIEEYEALEREDY